MIRKALDKLYLASGILSAVSLASIAVIIIIQVVGRLLGILVPSADEFAGYALASSTFLGLAYTFRENGHIRINMLTRRLSRRHAHLAEIYALTLGVAVLGYFSWYLIDMAWVSREFEEVSAGLIPVPLWIPQSVIAFGSTLMVVALVEELIKAVKGANPVYAEHGSGLNSTE